MSTREAIGNRLADGGHDGALIEHGLSNEVIASLPEDAVYSLALESPFMKRVFASTVEIEEVIEEETGLDKEAQARARKNIIGGAESQGMQLEKTEEGFTLSLTPLGKQKLESQLEKFRRTD